MPPPFSPPFVYHLPVKYLVGIPSSPFSPHCPTLGPHLIYTASITWPGPCFPSCLPSAQLVSSALRNLSIQNAILSRSLQSKKLQWLPGAEARDSTPPHVAKDYLSTLLLCPSPFTPQHRAQWTASCHHAHGAVPSGLASSHVLLLVDSFS